MEIPVKVVGQRLIMATNFKTLVSGTQEFIKFVFDLDDDWDNLIVFAQFVQDGVAYNQLLDAHDSAYLPAEIQPGYATMMLYGSGGTVKATVNYITFKINENILISDANSTEITQSLYDQLAALVSQYGGSVEDVETALALKADKSTVNTLTARVDAIANSLTTKADLSALNALSARVEVLEGTETPRIIY